MFCCGPAPLLPSYIWIICVGIALGGVGGSLVNKNSNAAMMHTEANEASLAQGAPLSDSQKQSLKSSVSAITTGAFGLGAILGPSLGAFLSDSYSFEVAFFIGSILVLGLSFL